MEGHLARLITIAATGVLSSCGNYTELDYQLNRAYSAFEVRENKSAPNMRATQANAILAKLKPIDEYSFEFPHSNCSIQEYEGIHSRVFSDYDKDGFVDEITTTITTDLNTEQNVFTKNPKNIAMPQYRIMPTSSKNR